MAIRDVDALREIYRLPGAPAIKKQIAAPDEHCRAFIAHSPLVMLASTAADGSCDVSPKGGPPGFVAVLDDDRLALGVLSGNNRLDSMQNVLAGGGVGLLFLIPGLDETLPASGARQITRLDHLEHPESPQSQRRLSQTSTVAHARASSSLLPSDSRDHGGTPAPRGGCARARSSPLQRGAPGRPDRPTARGSAGSTPFAVSPAYATTSARRGG